MALTLVTASEPIIGANHPRYPDTKNRQGQELEALMLIEHEEDTGIHAGRSYVPIIESGSFSGDGLASQAVSLSNSNLLPKYVEIWADSIVVPCIMLDDAWGNWVGGVSDIDIDQITGQITAYSGHNDSGTTYYYFVVGIDTETTFTGDAGAGSDPSWIGDGITLLGGNSAQTANSVENAIYTAFTHEHTAAGVHNPSIFDFRMETGWYKGDATDGRTIYLSLSDLDVKFVLCCKMADIPVMRSEEMTGDVTKVNAYAALQANYIEELGTGYFVVGSSQNTNNTIFKYLVIGE